MQKMLPVFYKVCIYKVLLYIYLSNFLNNKYKTQQKITIKFQAKWQKDLTNINLRANLIKIISLKTRRKIYKEIDNTKQKQF